MRIFNICLTPRQSSLLSFNISNPRRYSLEFPWKTHLKRKTFHPAFHCHRHHFNVNFVSCGICV